MSRFVAFQVPNTQGVVTWLQTAPSLEIHASGRIFLRNQGMQHPYLCS